MTDLKVLRITLFVNITNNTVEETRKTIKKEVIRRRMSIRKKSIFYQDVSRFGDESRKVSGDFAAVQEGILGVEGAGSISSCKIQ